MANQNVILFDKYGKQVVYQDIDQVRIPKESGGAPAVFYDTSDADSNAAHILTGYAFYGPNGKLQGQINTYAGSYNITSPSVTLYTAGKYCTSNFQVSVPGGGTLPVGVCTLTYKTEENIVYAEQYVKEGVSTQAPTPPSPPQGKVFVGWTINGDIQAFPFAPTGDTTLTARFITPAEAIVGVTGVTREDGALTLTDDATAMGGYTFQRKGPYVRVTNPLDSIFPFNEIREQTDTQGNVFIRIPKMSIKWLTTEINGISVIDGIKFSKNESGDGWFTPSCFKNPLDWDGSFLNAVCIGKYETSAYSSRGVSLPGKTPTSGTRASFRTNARAGGGTYQQLDLSIFTLYNFLCMTYLQLSNIRYAFYQGRIAYPGGYTGACSTGQTQEIDAAFGFSASTDVPLTGWNDDLGVLEILGVENPFGNMDAWIDGVVFSGTSTSIRENPQDFTDLVEIPYVDINFVRPTQSGYVKYLSYSSDHPSLAFPRVIGDGANFDTYLGVYYSYDPTAQVLMGGGCWNDASSAGLWFSNSAKSTYSATFTGSRLCNRPLT